jgi:hypothetical protein
VRDRNSEHPLPTFIPLEPRDEPPDDRDEPPDTPPDDPPEPGEGRRGLT